MIHIESEQQFYEEVKKKPVSVLKIISERCIESAVLNSFICNIAEDFHDFNWFQLEKERSSKLTEMLGVNKTPCLIVLRSGEKIAHLFSKFTLAPEDVRKFLNAIREYYINK